MSSRYDSDTTRRFDQQFAESPHENHWPHTLKAKLKSCEEALAASQREREQLQADKEFSSHVVNEQAMMIKTLQARVEAAEKLIDRWRAVQNPTPAPVYQVYGFCADDLERALSPPATPVQAEEKPMKDSTFDSRPVNQQHPLFDRIWEAIKGWDIERTHGAGYACATGTDVQIILDAIDAK